MLYDVVTTLWNVVECCRYNIPTTFLPYNTPSTFLQHSYDPYNNALLTVFSALKEYVFRRILTTYDDFFSCAIPPIVVVALCNGKYDREIFKFSTGRCGFGVRT